jgi:hypothetical protein
MRKDTLLRKTLKLVNDARRELDMKAMQRLPAGTLQHASACPLARSLGRWATVLEDRVLVPERAVGPLLRAWRTRAVFDENFDSPAVTLPSTLRKFVESFDRGDIPELTVPEE